MITTLKIILAILLLVDLAELQSMSEVKQETVAQTTVDSLLSILSDNHINKQHRNPVKGLPLDKPQSFFHDITGKWLFDIDFVSEYLHKGSEIQKTWCGYGWSEDEIQKRENFIRADVARNGPTVTYNISYLGGDSLKLLIRSNNGNIKEKVISQCSKQGSDIYICEQSPSSEQPFAFRFDGKYIYVMLRITPDMMKCKVRSASPSAFWIAVMRLKRSI